MQAWTGGRWFTYLECSRVGRREEADCEEFNVPFVFGGGAAGGAGGTGRLNQGGVGGRRPPARRCAGPRFRWAWRGGRRRCVRNRRRS